MIFLLPSFPNLEPYLSLSLDMQEETRFQLNIVSLNILEYDELWEIKLPIVRAIGKKRLAYEGVIVQPIALIYYEGDVLGTKKLNFGPINNDLYWRVEICFACNENLQEMIQKESLLIPEELQQFKHKYIY